MSTVKVRPETVRGERRWAVNVTENGKRKRSYWPSERAAENEAARLRDLMRQAGSAWARLTQEERDSLADLWSRAKREGVDLVRLFDSRETRAGLETRVSLESAIAQLLAAKRAANCRQQYLTNLRQCLAAFARGRESLPVDRVTVADVEAWLKAKGGTAWTRSMWRSRLSTLFSWCVRRGYCATSPVDRVDSVRIDHQPPKILTVEECRKLLKIVRADHPGALAWFVLGLFAGIRPGELDRLGWSSLNLKVGTVTIDAAASKIRARRIVTLEPSAVVWLRSVTQSSVGFSPPHTTRRRILRDVRGKMGWKSWPADILRHTAASYLLAHHQDVGKVSLNLGNSPAILMRHYRQLVTKEEAARWRVILPG